MRKSPIIEALHVKLEAVSRQNAALHETLKDAADLLSGEGDITPHRLFEILSRARALLAQGDQNV